MGASTEQSDGVIRVTVNDDDPGDVEAKVAGSDIEQPTSDTEAAPASVEDGSSEAKDASDQQDLSITQEEVAAKTAIEAAGLSLDDFALEYSEKGALSEESMSKLVDKAGIPRDIVEGYIAGQEALATQNVTAITSKAFEITGSQEQYQNLTEWAATNLSQGEQEVYNEAVNSMNPAQTEQAIRGLVQRRQASEGFEGSTVSGSTISGQRSDMYQDKTGMLADLSDTRYRTSAAFRATVDAKVARSMELHGGSIPS